MNTITNHIISSFGNNMERHVQLRSYYSLFLLFLLLFIISSHYTIAVAAIGTLGGGQEEEEEEQRQLQEQQFHIQEGKSRTPIIETVERMFSLPTSLPQISTSYWSKLESLIRKGKTYLSPPTLEDSQEAQGRDEGGAPGEKVKEAVLKSLDKSKATIEDSAKSAAKLAGDAMHKTTNKLKRTFSFGDGEPGQQADEL